MKVEVIKEFVDKHTNELHTKGSSFMCDEARISEIQSSGDFVKVVEENKAIKK